MQATYQVMSDGALIQECSTGSEAAWNELFSRYHRIRLRTVRRLLVLMARQDLTSARRILENVIAQAPTAIYPRVIHNHCLLQEGKDLAAAEEALQRVLELWRNHRSWSPGRRRAKRLAGKKAKRHPPASKSRIIRP
jgi:hypothetical protein